MSGLTARISYRTTTQSKTMAMVHLIDHKMTITEAGQLVVRYIIENGKLPSNLSIENQAPLPNPEADEKEIICITMLPEDKVKVTRILKLLDITPSQVGRAMLQYILTHKKPPVVTKLVVSGEPHG